METSKELLDNQPAIEPAAKAQDIDPQSWLAHADAVAVATGSVEVLVNSEPRSLTIAPITERENNELLKASKKFNKLDPRNPKMDITEYRLRTIAYSLNKANPGSNVTPDALLGQLTGQLTKIQEAIFKLSGLETDQRTDVTDFFA